MKLFQSGAAALGIYLSTVAALLFFIPPSLPVGLNTPGIDPVQDLFIAFFSGWVVRVDARGNALFICALAGVLLVTGCFCSRTSNLAIAGGTYAIGAFYFLFFGYKYASSFFAAIMPALWPPLVVNVVVLLAAAWAWSTLLKRRYASPAALPPSEGGSVQTTCSQCGATFQSNPKFCSACSAVLRK